MRSSKKSPPPMNSFLVVICFLQLNLSLSQRCLMDLWVFKTAVDCYSRFQNPSARALLYADGTCRETDLLLAVDDSAEELLPGTYSLRCLEGGAQLIEFTNSGCQWINCYGSSSSQVCDQQGDPSAALYSSARLPAVYQIYYPESRYESGVHACTTLNSLQGDELTFVIFGNCSDAACNIGSSQPAPTPKPTLNPFSSMSPSTVSPTEVETTTVGPTVAEKWAGRIPTPSQSPATTTNSTNPTPAYSSTPGCGCYRGVVLSSVALGVMVFSVAIVFAAFLLIRGYRRNRSMYEHCGQGDAISKINVQHSNESPRSFFISVLDMDDDLSTLQSPSVIAYELQHNVRRPKGHIASDNESNIPTSSSLAWTSEFHSRIAIGSDGEEHADRIAEPEATDGHHFNIIALDGELVGLHIDDSDGNLQVASIQANCELAGHVQIGDRLVAINGIDVADSIWAEARRLINQRRVATFELTFYRPPEMDEWGFLAPENRCYSF